MLSKLVKFMLFWFQLIRLMLFWFKLNCPSDVKCTEKIKAELQKISILPHKKQTLKKKKKAELQKIDILPRKKQTFCGIQCCRVSQAFF